MEIGLRGMPRLTSDCAGQLLASGCVVETYSLLASALLPLNELKEKSKESLSDIVQF